MASGFVLTGTAPAAKAFLIEIVTAVVAGDPFVSAKMIDGACVAVRDLPGFTPIERRAVLDGEIAKLRAADMIRDHQEILAECGVNQIADLISRILREGSERNLKRHKRGAGPWHRGAF